MANKIEKDVELGITNREGKRAVLVLSTAKGFNNGIRCSVAVFWTDGLFRSTVLFGDYRANLATTDKRATQKAIDTQHALVFTEAEIELQIATAKKYYAAKQTPEETK